SVHTPAGFAPSHVLPALLPGTALAFAYSDVKMLVGGDESAPTIPTLDELAAAGIDGIRRYLGELSGTPCVAIVLPNDFTAPPGLRLSGLRALFFRVPEPLVAIGARAFQVVEWDRTHRFCGRCGTPTQDKAGERAKECPACHYVAYPRVSPAMMALVTRGREMLLARSHRFPAGMYSALAGFVEPGETIEDCVRREVKEEVGVDVGALSYFASQSWSFPHSLMIAYTAEYAGGELVPDGEEIADVRWFPADALPDMPPSLSIARRLIDTTAARLRAG
ncbi:MAG TPA: NAD(+) diphosphatase, partial [Casimicrobiaceae bacterium]|nr:NAD(+) diphosphatase [Casimicrobiaceae bacterium]